MHAGSSRRQRWKVSLDEHARDARLGLAQKSADLVDVERAPVGLLRPPTHAPIAAFADSNPKSSASIVSGVDSVAALITTKGPFEEPRRGAVQRPRHELLADPGGAG